MNEKGTPGIEIKQGWTSLKLPNHLYMVTEIIKMKEKTTKPLNTHVHSHVFAIVVVIVRSES